MNPVPTLLERAQLVAAEIAENAAALDRSGTFPAEAIARVHRAGLSALTAPKTLGGRDASFLEVYQVIGAIAEAEPSTALILSMQYIHLRTLLRSRAPAHLIENVVTSAVEDGALINALRVEPDLGTPLRGGLPATTAERTAAGWRISGRKIYSTGAAGLSWAWVWARTDEDEPRVGGFLVPMAAPGIHVERSWDQLGMRASASDDVVFDKVEVPADHAADIRLPQQWGPPEGAQAALHALLVPAIYDGVARAARNWLAGFLNARRPSNLGDSLASVPRIQQAVGEIEEKLAANRRLLRSVAVEADAGEYLSASEAALLKLTVTENAIAATEIALRLSGNHGVSRSNPLERHYRNVLCGRIHSPQEDSARQQAGRLALTLDTKGAAQ